MLSILPLHAYYPHLRIEQHIGRFAQSLMGLEVPNRAMSFVLQLTLRIVLVWPIKRTLHGRTTALNLSPQRVENRARRRNH